MGGIDSEMGRVLTAAKGPEATVGIPSYTGHWHSLRGHPIGGQWTVLPTNYVCSQATFGSRHVCRVSRNFYTWMFSQCVAMDLRLQAIFRRIT